jgi:uncharacterized integral membrane protein
MEQTQRRRGGGLLFVVGILVGIPVTIFAVSNLESATVEFLGWTAQVPLWAVIALSLLAGALLGIAALLTWQARRKHGRKQAARRKKQAAVDSGTSAAPGAAEQGDRAAGDAGTGTDGGRLGS